jgi:hypothetical protein
MSNTLQSEPKTDFWPNFDNPNVSAPVTQVIARANDDLRSKTKGFLSLHRLSKLRDDAKEKLEFLQETIGRGSQTLTPRDRLPVIRHQHICSLLNTKGIRYPLLDIVEVGSPFPVKITTVLNDEETTCNHSQELESALSNLFHDPKVVQLVHSMLLLSNP